MAKLINELGGTGFYAKRAECDGNGNNIPDTYMGKSLVLVSAPTEKPQYVGQECIDASSETIYKAVDTSSASDWKEMATKAYVDGLVGDIESLLAAL